MDLARGRARLLLQPRLRPRPTPDRPRSACSGPRSSIAADLVVSEQRTALIRSVALLKRNALAAPFERAFAIQKQLEANPPTADEAPRDPRQDLMAIDYRPEEAIYVIPSIDRVTVIFSTIFREDVDMVFGRVFLQVRPPRLLPGASGS